jgi:ketosteroid isomerase-like protein
MSSTRLIVFIALIIYPATFSLSQEQAAKSNSKAEDQVMQLERDWLAADAKGDAIALRRIIAEDFIGSSFNGALLSKEDIIPEGTEPGGFAGATPGETTVRVFGDTGVLMGVINTGAGPQAKPIRVTLVCQKRTQGWQIIATQMTMQ